MTDEHQGASGAPRSAIGRRLIEQIDGYVKANFLDNAAAGKCCEDCGASFRDGEPFVHDQPFGQPCAIQLLMQSATALRACAEALAPAPLDPMVEAQLQKEIAGALKERREIYDQAPATYGSEQGRWSYLAQCNASHLADLVQRLSTLRGAPEPKGLTRDDCIALENLCTAKARAVQESSPDDADEFRRLMQKVLRLRADALAPAMEDGLVGVIAKCKFCGAEIAYDPCDFGDWMDRETGHTCARRSNRDKPHAPKRVSDE